MGYRHYTGQRNPKPRPAGAFYTPQTGRTSVERQPNVQNLPIRTDEGRRVAAAFRPILSDREAERRVQSIREPHETDRPIVPTSRKQWKQMQGVTVNRLAPAIGLPGKMLRTMDRDKLESLLSQWTDARRANNQTPVTQVRNMLRRLIRLTESEYAK